MALEGQPIRSATRQALRRRLLHTRGSPLDASLGQPAAARKLRGNSRCNPWGGSILAEKLASLLAARP